MNLIEKWLLSNNFDLQFYKYYNDAHYNGKSFYNDGTFRVARYKITNTNWVIDHKITGRPVYTLYNEDRMVIMEFSQREFIKSLDKNYKVGEL